MFCNFLRLSCFFFLFSCIISSSLPFSDCLIARTPTSTPTVKPTSVPTVYPTYHPVIYPTVSPTQFVPTLVPTLQQETVVTIPTTIELIVSSPAPFDTQTQNAIRDAMATTLGIDISSVVYVDTTFTANVRRTLDEMQGEHKNNNFNLENAPSFKASSNMNIVQQTTNYANFVSSVQNTLTSAVSGGSFTSTLQSTCINYGVINAVATATASTVSTGAPQVQSPPSFAPSSAPTPVPTSSPSQVKLSHF
jgi:hypothetical protein